MRKYRVGVKRTTENYTESIVVEGDDAEVSERGTLSIFKDGVLEFSSPPEAWTYMRLVHEEQEQ